MLCPQGWWPFMSAGNLTRRTFLRAAGLGATGVLLLRRQGLVLAQDYTTGDNFSYNEQYGYPPLLGRVHGAAWIRIFKGPSPDFGSVKTIYWGKVLPIYGSVKGERYDARAHSSVWFETEEGYVHSAYVVPCHEVYNEVHEVSADGFWGEVTVPIGNQYFRPSFKGRRYDYDYYRLYWGQVHRIMELAYDDDNTPWYRLIDDVEPNRIAWVPARNIRYVDPAEFTAITPDVLDKHIEIDLGEQMLTCFEGSRTVFKTRIASGTSLTDPNGQEIDFSTPFGDYSVQRKRPSRRMRGGESFNLPYDVNGVPWVTYFTYTGAAVHGAYWHNNFGLPRSHGCINVTPDAAKWVYRWSQPYMTYFEDYRWVAEYETATQIHVV